MGKYSIELVNSAGLLLADLSGMASGRRVTKSRNEAEEIVWNIDLNTLEEHCRRIGIHPRNLLNVGNTEARVKRGAEYLCGGQLTYAEPRLTKDEQSVDIKATGFLNLLADRYTSVERVFEATQATTIGATLINESQALTDGNFGITIGTLATVGVHDRTYRRTNLKDAIQAFGNLQSGAFDHEFTYDKIFNTYARLGSDRPEIIFEYPSNILDISVPLDASGIANEITALGRGNGEELQASAIAIDTASRLNYKLRQKIITSNGTDDSDNGITDAAEAEKAAWAWPFEIPEITVDGNIQPYITDYNIGDRVRVRIRNYQTLEHIDSMYRIEKYDLKIDENDNETVKLYLSV